MIQASNILWREFALDLVGRLPFGVVMTDRNARVRHMNARAEQLLTLQRGVRLVEGRVVGLSPSVNAELQQAIASGMDSVGSTNELRIVAPVPGTCRTVQILVAPLSCDPELHEIHGNNAVVLFLFATDQLAIEAMGLAEVYGLTAAEARVACGLVAGKRPAGIAAATGTTVNTVRTHVRRIFAKASCRSQAEFAHAVLTGPAVLGTFLPDTRYFGVTRNHDITRIGDVISTGDASPDLMA